MGTGEIAGPSNSDKFLGAIPPLELTHALETASKNLQHLSMHESNRGGGGGSSSGGGVGPTSEYDNGENDGGWSSSDDEEEDTPEGKGYGLLVS